jgi:hypothetical protein
MMGKIKSALGWIDPRSLYANDQWEPITRKLDTPELPVFNPNEHECFQIPLSTVALMWQAKFGDQWLNRNKALDLDSDFLGHAWRRLNDNNMFEFHEDWYRLKEDVCK